MRRYLGIGRSRHSLPQGPPWKIPSNFFAIWWVFCYFSLYGGLSTTFFSLWVSFFTMWGPFSSLFSTCREPVLSIWRGAFFGLAPPLRKFLGAHVFRYITNFRRAGGKPKKSHPRLYGQKGPPDMEKQVAKRW